MPMREKISQALPNAVRQQEKRRTSTLRLIQAAIKDRDIAHRGSGKDAVGDEEILEILARMVKQRKESARIYEDNARPDLAKGELEEIDIIMEFLPTPLSDDEMQQACAEIIKEIGAEGLRDMGRTMNVLKEKYAGRMDFSKASGIIRGLLS